MKILIDVDTLEEEGVLTPALAAVLRKHAVRDTGSTAINLLLAFGAVVLAAGAGALVPTASVALMIGLAFIGAGWFVSKNHAEQWGKLGSIWMVIGGLLSAGAVGMLVGYTVENGAIVERPMLGSIAGAAVLAAVALLAESYLLIALVPFALCAAIGSTTGYWHATYMVCIREPTLTIALFTALGLIGWEVSKRLRGVREGMAIAFTRVCVIFVNMGFWIGSLWGDTPGALWKDPEGSSWSYNYVPQIPATTFIVGWAVALLAAGAWGAKNGRRFLVNTVAVFGAIHFYTQWFEHLGADPLSVMIAGTATIGFGIALWKYNQKQVSA
ncbi:MAG: hypothetical protein V4691_10620 [Pseudomonadota bacterium]